MAGARRVASDVLSVLAIAKPFREDLPPVLTRTGGRTNQTPMEQPGLGLGTSVPARQPELLGLLLDILVVELGALLPIHLTGAHLDADLLQRRALDRRLELQGRAGLASVDVGLGVLGDLRHLGRQGALLGEEWAGRRVAFGVRVTARLA